jgi:hypothetical protein
MCTNGTHLQDTVGNMPLALLLRCYAEWELSQGLDAYALEALTAYAEGSFAPPAGKTGFAQQPAAEAHY